MKQHKHFGEIVKGYSIPVLNNRKIWATAGVVFLSAFISIVLILSVGNFVPVKYVLSLFLIEFSIRLFINPRFAPLLLIGRFIVGNQNPEYVGAAQKKKIAWYIGFVISAIMFLLLVIANAYSPMTGIACLICLMLMFFESAFGICLGCNLYRILKKDKTQYCSGEICVKQKHKIQKISGTQWLVFLGLVASFLLLSIVFQKNFKAEPYNLFQKKYEHQ